jgi:hypothetical protein
MTVSRQACRGERSSSQAVGAQGVGFAVPGSREARMPDIARAVALRIERHSRNRFIT